MRSWMLLAVVLGACTDDQAVDTADSAPAEYTETYTCQGLENLEPLSETSEAIQPLSAVGCYEDPELGCETFTPADGPADLVGQALFWFAEDTENTTNLLWEGEGWYISCVTHWTGAAEEDRFNIGYPWTITWDLEAQGEGE